MAPGGAILEDGPLEPHFQLLGFSSNWIIAQAYRHIAPRLQLDQLQQAAAVKGESYAEYERQLWILLQRAEDEMYEAIHAVVLAFKSVLGRSRRDKTDCMLSGKSSHSLFGEAVKEQSCWGLADTVALRSRVFPQ